MRFVRNNGLTIVLLLLFVGSLVGHWLTGVSFENQQLASHGEPPISAVQFLSHPQFLATVFENWESEFLQMSAYVVLTAFLFQKGSAESADPDKPPRDTAIEQASRKRGPRNRAARAMRWLYAHSLGTVLLVLFVASFVLHWLFSAREAAEQALAHGQPPVTMVAYIGDAQFWFESFQNWQSEFLSTAALVVFSIFLRQKDSPESKPVDAPHGQTGT